MLWHHRLKHYRPAKGFSDRFLIWQALRTLISRHRSHRAADWALPEERIDELEEIFNKLQPTDPTARFGWLFGHRPELPEGGEADWQAYEQNISTRQEEAVTTLRGDSGLNWIPALRDRIERPELLGSALARTDPEANLDNDVLLDNLNPEDVNKKRFLNGYLLQRTHDLGPDWLKQTLERHANDWSSAHRATFCLCLNSQPETWNIVDGLDVEARRQYWTQVAPAYVKLEEIPRVVRHLLDHRRPSVAIDLLSLHARGSALPGLLVAEALELFLAASEKERSSQKVSGHDVEDLLRIIAGSEDVDRTRVAALEWAFLPMLGSHSFKPACLLGEFSRDPAFFAKVVSLVYRADGGEQQTVTEEDAARARHGYELLESWTSLPASSGGTVNVDALKSWVRAARDQLRTNHRLAMGDHTIGRLFSSSPAGDDGAWPHPAVRDLIEELASDDVEQGVFTGVLNSRGTYCKNPEDGGDRERGIAERYDGYATIVSGRWVRTAALLRQIRDSYLADARDEDRRAVLRADLPP